MFRKILHIFIVALLLLATVGISVNKHFCSGELKTVSLFKSAKSCCGEGCNKCHNETKIVKITDDFVPSHFQIEQIKVLSFDWLALEVSELLFNNNSLFKSQISLVYPPPLLLLNVTPSFLQNFRC